MEVARKRSFQKLLPALNFGTDCILYVGTQTPGLGPYTIENRAIATAAHVAQGSQEEHFLLVSKRANTLLCAFGIICGIASQDRSVAILIALLVWWLGAIIEAAVRGVGLDSVLKAVGGMLIGSICVFVAIMFGAGVGS